MYHISLAIKAIIKAENDAALSFEGHDAVEAQQYGENVIFWPLDVISDIVKRRAHLIHERAISSMVP